MDGPWYQCSGPDVTYVRKNVNEILEKDIKLLKYRKLGKEFLLLKNKIIEEVIPQERNDFGSYRGYVTFGKGRELADEVSQKLIYQCALKILEYKFVPILINKYYKPKGNIYQKIADNTLVGKK